MKLAKFRIDGTQLQWIYALKINIVFLPIFQSIIGQWVEVVDYCYFYD